ncbi:MAG: hypothetical protein PHN31_03485, partial [Candidatus Gracilibacteria bacterium]|nr:hypothetical protein [Candidatus Gracilibacteria bacterium]
KIIEKATNSIINGGRRDEISNFILYLIKFSINSGLEDFAMYIYKSLQKVESSKLKNACIYHIMKSTKKQNKVNPGYLAFNNLGIQEEDNFTTDEKIDYYNIRSDLSHKLGKEDEYEINKEKIFELLNSSENKTKSIRLWCKNIVKYCLRTGHSTRFTPKSNGDKKTYSSENITPIFVELKDILNSSMGQNEKIRRRVIFTIIELGIIEANEIIKIEDFKSGSIPNRVQLMYMNKLVKKGLITNNTMHFLGKNKDKHISNLVKLLTNYQNIYNVIIENIHKYNEGISRQIERIKDDYIYRYIRNNEELNADNFQVSTEVINKTLELKKKLFKVSSWRKLFKVLRIFEGQSINYEVYTNNFHDITTHKKGPLFGYFMCVIRGNWRIDLSDFPINKDNFLNYMKDNETLIEFEKDKGIKWEKTKPWTKKWFLEDEKRLLYLDGDKLKTFEKFGSIIAIGIIEGIKDVGSIKKFYEYIFQNISYEKNRTSILQLGELFNLILKQGDYKIFEELINEKNNIGEDFKKFIETNKISDKGRTILTLMISKEIKESFSIWNDTKGEEKVDYIKIEELIKRVHSKLKLYQKEINKYNNFPIKISIGIEYEVTSSIARGYHERIGSDYKNDITTISEYAGISNGTDAIHEIATSPTDNPMLLILELKLLDDLDFLDLNFKHTDYEKGSRGIHITLGGEKGIKLDFDTNFIQNILIASNLGGLNAGNEIKTVNKHGKIREKGGDCKAVFTKEKTECVEFRSLGIDKKEQLERLIISIFNLCRAKHANDTFGAIAINDEKKVKAMELFSLLKKDIELIIENHNKNFLVNETKDDKNSQGLSNLINIVTSTSPLISLLKNSNIDIHYLRNLH